jgi:hypothetical protein
MAAARVIRDAEWTSLFALAGGVLLLMLAAAAAAAAPVWRVSRIDPVSALRRL